MAIEVQIKHPTPGSSRVLRFAQSPVRIGRNQLNDLPLEDPFVSEWHGTIRSDGNQIAYFDLGSTNGTLLDGKRLAKNVPATLTEASRLQIGMIEISVVLRADAPKPVDPPGRRESGPLKTIGWGIVPPSRLPHGATDAPIAGTDSSGNQRVEPKVPVGSISRGAGPLVDPSAPTPPPPGSQWADVQSPTTAASDLIVRQVKFIEAFSEAFVGLRKGYEQFGAEVGVRTVSGSTPLHRARTARELLDHLMLPSVDANATARGLIGIFADFGIHHIALMEGITEGVRAVLQSLNPGTNEDEGRGLWKSKSKNQLKGYLERLEQLLTDDEELHAAIFGDAFARAYASVTLGDGRGDRDGKDS